MLSGSNLLLPAARSRRASFLTDILRLNNVAQANPALDKAGKSSRFPRQYGPIDDLRLLPPNLTRNHPAKM